MKQPQQHTVGDLRRIIKELPDDAPVLVDESLWGKDNRAKAWNMPLPSAAHAIQQKDYDKDYRGERWHVVYVHKENDGSRPALVFDRWPYDD